MVAPEEKKVDVTGGQLQLLGKIRMGYNAAAITNTQDLAGDAITVWNILNIVRSGKPATGVPNRIVYDKAVQDLGNKSEDAAKQVLLQTLMGSLDALSAKVHASTDAGANGPALRNTLILIQSDMQAPDHYADYSAYRGMSEKIAALKSALSSREAWAPGARAIPAPSAAAGASATKALEETGAIGEQGRVIMMRPIELSPIFYGKVQGNLRTLSLGGTATPDQKLIFDTDPNAQTFVSALGYGIAADASKIDQTQALDALRTTVGHITDASVLASPSFQDALAYLNGTRGQGLTDAQKLTIVLNDFRDESLGVAMNGIYTTASHLATVTVDQRAITVFTARGTVTLDLGDMDKYYRYLGTPGTDKFAKGVVSLAMGLAYDYLNVTGELIETTAGQVTGRERLVGSGQVLSATPQVWWSGSWGANPVQIILHCNVGYEEIVMPTIMSVSATGERVGTTPEKKDWYLGIYGVELRRPGRYGMTAPIRFERFAAGGLGAQGAFALTTVSWTPHEGDKTTLQFFVTPEYLGIVNIAKKWMSRPSLEVGGRLELRSGERLTSFDPSVKVEYDATAQTYMVQAGAGVTYRPSSTWAFTIRGGALVDMKGGIDTRKLATKPVGYVSADAVFNIGAPKRKAPAASALEAVPAKLAAPPQWDSSVTAVYVRASEYAARKKSETTVEETAKLARELAGSIENQVYASDAMNDIARMALYKEAITSLRLGDLKKGLSLLKRAGLF